MWLWRVVYGLRGLHSIAPLLYDTLDDEAIYNTKAWRNISIRKQAKYFRCRPRGHGDFLGGEILW